MRIALINMPFAALDTPSLALGLFKSKLNNLGMDCDVRYLNFDFAEFVGTENYDFVLRLSAVMAGEQLFAKSVFGQQVPTDNEYYRQMLASESMGREVPQRLEQIRPAVTVFLQQCLDSIPWARYDVVGFTTLFEQNLPSLALAKLIKQHWPNKIIVFGGANCEEIMGLTLHRCFPFVDFVCTGEADKTFPELLQRIQYGHPVRNLNGVVSRSASGSEIPGPPEVIDDLNELPIPDYDNYFRRLNNSSLRQWIRPSLLMESARGCWWGEKSHCTFCGLNGLTMKFRTKEVGKTVGEMGRQISRYGTRLIRFVDNIIDPGYFKSLLPAIIQRGIQSDIIFEVKSNLKKDQIKILADAGVTVQAGIENLSTHVLKLMGKGSNALMNIQTLKWCKQYGVLADWNLLYGFPGEGPEDYRINKEYAEVLTHLDPPTGCGPIRLDRFSPNYNFAHDKGLSNIRPMKFYRYLYPFDEKTLCDLVYYFEFDYTQEIDDGGYRESLENAIWQWKSRRDQLYSQRKGETLVIHDTRPIATWRETLLSGPTALIYEYCDKARSPQNIVEAVAQNTGETLNHDQVGAILEEFLTRKLMVKDDNKYLSLAVMTYVSQVEHPAPKQAHEDREPAMAG